MDISALCCEVMTYFVSVVVLVRISDTVMKCVLHSEGFWWCQCYAM